MKKIYYILGGIVGLSFIIGGYFFPRVDNFVGRTASQHSGMTMVGDIDMSNNEIDNVDKVGIGTSTPYIRLSVVGGVVAENYIATSTTASSTMANGINITDGCFAVDGVCIK